MRITRRTLLGTVGSGVLGIGTALLIDRNRAAAISLSRRVCPADGEPLPPVVEPALAPDTPRVSFFAVGDTGWQNGAKAAVSSAMAMKASGARPDFVLLLGDTFYPNGVSSTDDPRWGTHFEEAFAHPSLQVPFFSTLGNHDHGGDIAAYVEYARTRSTRWRMPAAYYSFTQPIQPGCEVQFFVLDTTPIRLKDESADAQLRWFADELARSTARWKIVVGHHPVVSGGDHGGSSNVRRRIAPLFVEHDVDLYLAGHDHDLQLLTLGRDQLQVVSGAGCSTRPVHGERETHYAEAEPGFVWIRATESDLWIEFVTAAQGSRFGHQVIKFDAPVECG